MKGTTLWWCFFYLRMSHGFTIFVLREIGTDEVVATDKFYLEDNNKCAIFALVIIKQTHYGN